MFHGSRGATLGKQALGIRIQRLSGKRLGYGRAFVRYWASWLSILPLMGGFWIAFLGPQRRTLHDWVCGSVAVRAESLQEVQLITTS